MIKKKLDDIFTSATQPNPNEMELATGIRAFIRRVQCIAYTTHYIQLFTVLFSEKKKEKTYPNIQE